MPDTSRSTSMAISHSDSPAAIEEFTSEESKRTAEIILVSILEIEYGYLISHRLSSKESTARQFDGRI